MLYAGFDNDREYLINKFRKPVFEKGSGMDQDEIRENILSVADGFEEQAPLPHK